MPPKRCKVGGSSVKTPTQPRAKRTRRVYTQAAVHDATHEALTATAAAALTGLKDPSHLHSADAGPSLIIDCTESTHLRAVKASVVVTLGLPHHLRFQLALRQHHLRMLSRRLCLLAQRRMITALPSKVQVIPLVRRFIMVQI